MEKRITKNLEKCVGCTIRTNKQFEYDGRWYTVCKVEHLTSTVIQLLKDREFVGRLLG